MSQKITKSIHETLEQKMSRLSHLVEWFESDDFSIEQSFDHFNQAQDLAADIEKELQTFSNTVSVLAQKFDQG